jgi:hypothetical protein
MNQFFTFDEMVTPKIITLIYWLLLASVVIFGLKTMLGGYGFSIGNIFQGLITIVFGALAVRIWCELLIVLFKMNEALQEIRKNNQ